ncbi:acyl-CoA dehydrogenase [Nocardia nova SH22a]|uniref:Acyl-CoA dehydrogenase n=1 Tax=Nocardia nova SH22a TaxID=1415166 RepID=W5TMF0_9NOCA|nr:acyl-CoA dehydrogenase family protein [Nocardia nova]AHH18391.1 acyl-CoA dehydrogenase [Nocardia nova SH22a]
MADTAGAGMQDLQSFRTRARAWLADNAEPAGERGSALVTGFDSPDVLAGAREFQARQYEAGFSGITWPSEYGGQGLPVEFQRAWNEEATGYFLPSSIFAGVTHSIMGRTLLDHGSEEQKRRYIPAMLRGEHLWVQLLSEPDGGSDLAGLTTRAVLDGDRWLLNGSKVWSSGAATADFALCPARTDPDVVKHAGITLFIVPLKSPGVTIRPLRQITGSAEFCQEFFDDVELGPEHVVGRVNDGWGVTRTLLMHERNMAAGGGMGGLVTAAGGRTGAIDDLIALAQDKRTGHDPHIRQLIGEAAVMARVYPELSKRVLALVGAGRLTPHGASVIKMVRDGNTQRRAEITMAIAGGNGIAWNPDDASGARFADDYLGSRSATIVGGTAQIQRNIVGERVLGLPREPEADPGVPFSRIRRRRDDRTPS